MVAPSEFAGSGSSLSSIWLASTLSRVVSHDSDERLRLLRRKLDARHRGGFDKLGLQRRIGRIKSVLTDLREAHQEVVQSTEATNSREGQAHEPGWSKTQGQQPKQSRKGDKHDSGTNGGEGKKPQPPPPGQTSLL